MNQSHNLAAIHVVDDDDSFRAGMLRLLTVAGLECRGYCCAGEFLLARPNDARGCMLLDIAMPGPSGVDLLKALVDRELTLPVIFVTARDDVYTSVDVMKAGAFDYLVKPVGAERILPAVRTAMQVDFERRNARCEFEELQERFSQLTDKERAIFEGIQRNRLNKQLAVELGTCERTIKSQRARMMAKLKVSSLPELVRVARLLEVGLCAAHLPEKKRWERLQYAARPRQSFGAQQPASPGA